MNIQTSSLGPPSPGQGMKLCQGLCPMVGQDFGIQWLPLPLCGDFSAKLCAGAPAAAYPHPPPPNIHGVPPEHLPRVRGSLLAIPFSGYCFGERARGAADSRRRPSGSAQQNVTQDIVPTSSS